ncbi:MULTISPECIES: hypothetical protein [unclassified Moorena]|uniref:hypothetical protein n=1 Tax=unclassified Moorena TaxID=2683338 RepID=UPI0013C6059A|nr:MULTISPECIES: hypothetical protein [unclassified Moorena]NEO22690.1 hypothetical protein [Moorena sp. SIO4A5]NEQ60238.1 hypothetical protein [Moorena sp. SIO4A1]
MINAADSIVLQFLVENCRTAHPTSTYGKTWEKACDYHPDANKLDDLARLLSENR